MKILKSIWNGFNWLFGGGTKAHTNVIDLSPALTMAQAKKACDAGFKVRYCGWNKGNYIYKNKNEYVIVQTGVRIFTFSYHWDFSGPDSMGSWEIA